MINSLTTFRFITAFVVFIYHCKGHLGLKFEDRLIEKFFSHGAVFMTGFFVLSGFIMVHVYQNWDFSCRKNIFNFYLKRFAKIYPTYIIATIVFFAFYQGESFSGAEWIRIIANDLFLTQAFFPSMFDLGLNGGTWSLTVEAFLYLLFPLLFIISGKSKKTIFAAILLGIIITLNVNFDKAIYAYANPVVRLADFVMGMGFYFIKDHEFFKKKLAHMLVVILLIFSTMFLGGKFYMSGHGLFILLFGAWIACVYHAKSWIYQEKLFVYLGKISYSFYLWQFWALYLAKDLLFDPVINSVVAFYLNVIFSVISYHLLEEPTRKRILKKWLK